MAQSKGTLTTCLAVATLTSVLLACDRPADAGPLPNDARRPAGKADKIVGSCANLCNESAGDCWCDDLCAEYGDCCPDVKQQCGVDVCQAQDSCSEEPSCVADLTPPSITGWKFQPDSVDVTDGPALVDLWIDATDDASGIAGIGAMLRGNDPLTIYPADVVTGAAILEVATYDATHQRYHAQIEVPQHLEPGQYWALLAYADVVGNAGIAPLGLGTPLTVHNTGMVDSEPPEAPHNVVLSPAQIDPETGRHSVRLTFESEDDVRGVQEVSAFLRAGSPLTSLGPFDLGLGKWLAHRGSFDPDLGVWVVDIELPEGPVPHSYGIVVRQDDGLSQIDSMSTLWEDFEVSGAEPPHPELRSVQFDNDEIDTSAGSTSFEVQFAFDDNVTGISFSLRRIDAKATPGHHTMRPFDPSAFGGRPGVGALFFDPTVHLFRYHVATLDHTSGTATARVDVPPNTPAGLYAIDELFVHGPGNVVEIGSREAEPNVAGLDLAAAPILTVTGCE